MSISSEITRINNEVTNQANLISQIATALEGKAGGGSSVTFGDFDAIDNGMVEPGMNEFILTANNLQTSTKTCVLIGFNSDDEFLKCDMVLYRSNTDESFCIITAATSDLTASGVIVAENTVTLYAPSFILEDYPYVKFTAY